jgi:hypothetical protein
VNEALSLRPELIIVREDLKVRQLELIREKNNLLPDLRFNGGYNIHGFGNTLSGTGSLPPNANGVSLPANALQGLASTHFSDWNVSLTLNIPLGYRNAYASVRQARLRLAEGYVQVRDQEDKAVRLLALAYRNVSEQYATIQARRAERESYARELASLYELVRTGKITPSDRTYGDSLLDAQRNWANALQQEAAAIVAYNNSFVIYEFAKGTILQHDNIVISEGALPACAAVRAVDHERERAKALLLHERANPGAYPACVLHGELPAMPVGHAPSLATLLPDKLTAPQTPMEELPRPRLEPTSHKSTLPAPPQPSAPPAFLPPVAAAGLATPTVLNFTKEPDVPIDLNFCKQPASLPSVSVSTGVGPASKP